VRDDAVGVGAELAGRKRRAGDALADPLPGSGGEAEEVAVSPPVIIWSSATM
jgi:hypothetical protein